MIVDLVNGADSKKTKNFNLSYIQVSAKSTIKDNPGHMVGSLCCQIITIDTKNGIMEK